MRQVELEMSDRERDRLVVMRLVAKGRMSQRVGARQLNIIGRRAWGSDRGSPIRGSRSGPQILNPFCTYLDISESTSIYGGP